MAPKKRGAAAATISSPRPHPDMMLSEEAIFGVGTRRLSFFHSKDAEAARCRREQEKTKFVMWITFFTLVLLTVLAVTTIVKFVSKPTMSYGWAELISFIELGTLYSLFSFKNVFLLCLR